MQLSELQEQYHVILRQNNEKIFRLIQLALNRGMLVEIVCASLIERDKWNEFMGDHCHAEFKSQWKVVSVADKTDEECLRINASHL